MTASSNDFEERLRDAKLAALAEFAAGAGHEINNPVATILGRAQQLLRHEQDPNRRRSLATIAAQALRIRDMIGDLMLFARPPAPQPRWVDLAALVTEIMPPLRELAEAAEIALQVEASTTSKAYCDPLQISVAVAALIENAIEASPRGSVVVVSVAEREGLHEIAVEDRGIGFSETDREHAFDPFYSGRQAGRGLGFGLPKAWRIITLAGGTMTIESSSGESSESAHTIATILLPNLGPRGSQAAHLEQSPRRRRR